MNFLRLRNKTECVQSLMFAMFLFLTYVEVVEGVDKNYKPKTKRKGARRGTRRNSQNIDFRYFIN